METNISSTSMARTIYIDFDTVNLNIKNINFGIYQHIYILRMVEKSCSTKRMVFMPINHGMFSTYQLAILISQPQVLILEYQDFYPLVNKHNYGNHIFLMEKRTINANFR